ncbi:hypothetical protein SADUNF_Sadunf18G0102600 [Salix dunnii]|uniref:Gag1-like clamp domain-containing protein n=1 Tax=Salix dunnii TaxID=1413687 RepID=A0A835MJ78_9ROSI|nr:hypothetical protein SADUNF_Sadunf18G0102600 [Salix dunnii]
MVILNSSMPAWIGHFLAFMGNMNPCYALSVLALFRATSSISSVAMKQKETYELTAVDEPSKGLRIQGRAVNKPSISNDFWSSSTCDLDYSTVQSQRSISSISVSNFNPGCSSGGMSSNYEFVNHGLLLWQQSRLQWVGSGTSGNQNQRRWESRLSWNATEGLLGSTNPFPRPIPLSEMVDFLVDLWEQEGLYD